MSTLAELAIEGRLKVLHWRALCYLFSVAGASDLAPLGVGKEHVTQAAEHLMHRGLAEQVPGTFTWQLTSAGRALFGIPSAPPQPAQQAASKAGHAFLARPKEQQQEAFIEWMRIGARLDLRTLAMRAVFGGPEHPETATALDYAERIASRAGNEESARQP